MTDFEPLSDIPMDKQHMLDQSTSRFQGVKEGLPELVKNSKDHYGRLAALEKNSKNLDKSNRQIIVLVSPDMQRLGVLDFGGASDSDLANDKWAEWSSRSAGRAELGADIEAGYGNGGKSFMARGATKEAYICGLYKGRLSKRGFKNDETLVRYQPMWARDPQGRSIKAVPVSDPEAVLNEELSHFKITINDLPPPARNLLRERKNFTIVQLVTVKDWQTRRREKRVTKIPEELSNHAQAALTIETCTVWVQRGRSLLHPSPLDNVLPDPQPGFEPDKIPPIPIPDFLSDPETGDKISTGPGTPEQKYLKLMTSKEPLLYSKRKALNYIRIRNERNIVGNWPLSMLARASTSQFIYGTLRIPALIGEHLAGSDRQVLADTPLVRALQKWIDGPVNELAEKIQKAAMSRDAPEDRNRTTEALRRLRELMRKYLEAGENGDSPTREYGSRIDVIELVPFPETLCDICP